MKNCFLLVLLVLGLIGYSQQDVQFTQFKEYALFYNPAYAGVSNDICGDVLARNQWAGFEGAPKTLFFDVRYATDKLHGGIGLSVVSDELGFQKNTLVNVSYSYKNPINNIGTLYIGISAGMNRGSWQGNFIPPESINDPYIPVSGQSASIFSSNFGLFFKGKDLYVGLSGTNINQAVFKDATNPQFNFNSVRHYYVIAGYKTRLNRTIELEPIVFAKSDGGSTQVDLKTKVIFDNKLFGGLNYRLGDAFSPILGMHFGNGNTRFTFTYSYDITTSKIRSYSSGSHEIALSVCIKMPTVVSRHDNPRNMGGAF